MVSEIKTIHCLPVELNNAPALGGISTVRY